MKRMTAILAMVGLGLAACSSGDTAGEGGAPAPASQTNESRSADASVDEFLADNGLEGMTGVEIVDYLDEVPRADRRADLMASVRYDELLLASPTGEVSVPLDTDMFYLSIAPYVSGTHECYYHSLTTCVGEMSNEAIDLRITTDDGDVLYDEAVTTFDNGFAGVWIPKNLTGTIEVSAGGKTGSVPFDSGEDGPTCITTLRLA